MRKVSGMKSYKLKLQYKTRTKKDALVIVNVLKSDFKKLVCGYYIITHRLCQTVNSKVPAYIYCSK